MNPNQPPTAERTQAFVQATIADLRQAEELFGLAVDPILLDNLIHALERIS